MNQNARLDKILSESKWVVGRINSRPLLVDQDRLFRTFNQHKHILEVFRTLINSAAGREVDPDSNEQIRTLLFRDLLYPVISKSPGGKPSVSSEVLKKLLKEYDQSLIRHLVSYREVGSICKALKSVSNKMQDGVVFPELSDRSKALRIYSPWISLEAEARKCLIPNEGNVFIMADFRAQELLLAALMAGEKSIPAMVSAGDDVHEFVARELFKKLIVTPQLRKLAKTISYAIQYGSDAKNLSWKLNLPHSEADALLNSWKRLFPNLTAFWIGQHTLLDRNGYLDSPFGARFSLDQTLKSQKERERDRRRCLNGIIQSSGAVLLREAMIRAEQMGLKISMVRHDAIICEVERCHVDRDLARLIEAMSVEFQGVVFPVETSAGEDLAFSDDPDSTSVAEAI